MFRCCLLDSIFIKLVECSLQYFMEFYKIDRLDHLMYIITFAFFPLPRICCVVPFSRLCVKKSFYSHVCVCVCVFFLSFCNVKFAAWIEFSTIGEFIEMSVECAHAPMQPWRYVYLCFIALHHVSLSFFSFCFWIICCIICCKVII